MPAHTVTHIIVHIGNEYTYKMMALLPVDLGVQGLPKFIG